MLDRQRNSQSKNGGFLIAQLTSLLSRLRPRAGGTVLDEDARLDLVAMLSSWSRSTLASNLAVFK